MPVQGEDEPVQPNEYVLRRVPNIKHYIDTSLPTPLQRGAVGPSPSDVDGLSVYREKFVTAQEVAESGRSADGYYVVRFKVSDLNNLGLEVVPSPIVDGLPGHALMPHLCTDFKVTDRQAYKALTRKLVKLVSESDIVYWPG